MLVFHKKLLFFRDTLCCKGRLSLLRAVTFFTSFTPESFRRFVPPLPFQDRLRQWVHDAFPGPIMLYLTVAQWDPRSAANPFHPLLCVETLTDPPSIRSPFRCTVDGGDLGAGALHQPRWAVRVQPLHRCSSVFRARSQRDRGLRHPAPNTLGRAVWARRVLPSNTRARPAPFDPQISGCEATRSCDNVLRVKTAEKIISADVIVVPWMDDKEQHAAPGCQAFSANSASDCLNVFLFHSACCASPRVQPPATTTTWNVKRERLFLQYLSPNWKQQVPETLGKRLFWRDCQLRFAGPKGSGGLNKLWMGSRAAGRLSELNSQTVWDLPVASWDQM